MKLGSHEAGEGCPAYVIAEGGISANGSMETAKRMTQAAAEAGAQAIKWQKRTVETLYSRPPYAPDYLDQPRSHPLSDDQTQRGQKTALEFTVHQHAELKQYAESLGLDYTVSCWDEVALAEIVDAVAPSYLKVASPCLTDGPLMRAHGATGLPLVVSTGMANEWEIDKAIEDIGYGADEQGREPPPMVLLHCCSSYPAEDSELNLACMQWMKHRWDLPVGYSGHERGIATSVVASALGACVIERHLTLDRTMYGSDQAASLEPHGFAQLVRDIRAGEAAIGDGVKRPRECEAEAARKLRRVVE